MREWLTGFCFGHSGESATWDTYWLSTASFALVSYQEKQVDLRDLTYGRIFNQRRFISQEISDDKLVD